MVTLIISLRKQEKERLVRLALRYGLSLPEFSQKVLEGVASEISEESFMDYENSRALRASFSRALRDYRNGHVHRTL